MLIIIGLASCLIVCTISCAQAKLTEDFTSYLNRFTKASKALKPVAQLPGVTTQHYTFETNIPADQQKASPGFACGVTISVTDGKIVGQSLAVRLGNNINAGQKLAAIHGFAFAYEAIGKPLPETRAKAETEFRAFSNAIESAYLGDKQYLRYPGFKSQVTIRTDPSTGNLLIAVTLVETPAPKPPAIAPKP